MRWVGIQVYISAAAGRRIGHAGAGYAAGLRTTVRMAAHVQVKLRNGIEHLSKDVAVKVIRIKLGFRRHTACFRIQQATTGNRAGHVRGMPVVLAGFHQVYAGSGRRKIQMGAYLAAVPDAYIDAIAF